MLKARQVQTLGAGKWEDGDGLRLIVTEAGSRRWVLRIMTGGRRREFGLGPYPRVSLADARAKAREYRDLVEQGQDPTAKAETMPTFAEVARLYIDAHDPGWSSRRHAQQWTNTLRDHAAALDALPVDQIKTEHVLKVLDPIWTTKPVTAGRVARRIESILDYAKARGWRAGDNPAAGRGHLTTLLPRRLARAVHHPAMDYRDLPAFMRRLGAVEGVAPRALEFLILTACRSSEAMLATWDEIEGSVWTIPPARMKARREHRVPLSGAVLGILAGLPRVDAYLFPGTRAGRPLGDTSLRRVLRDLGVEGITVHGFRSSFRDWCAEQTATPRAVAEAALAHEVAQNQVEAAYLRSDFFAKRVALAQQWADYLGNRFDARRR